MSPNAPTANRPGGPLLSYDRRERSARWGRLAGPVVSPSLLNCDFGDVAAELAALERADVAIVHLDVMDGHFVPNLSYGPPVVARWRERTDLIFDAHLMMAEPGRYFEAFAAAGCDALTIHVEAVEFVGPALGAIRALGLRAGLAINPPTPWQAVEPHLDGLDSVLIMSVMPGFGGQAFDPGSLDKVRALRRARPELWIGIDGGINDQTIRAAVSAGVSQLVAGSAVFRPGGDATSLARALIDSAALAASSRGLDEADDGRG